MRAVVPIAFVLAALAGPTMVQASIPKSPPASLRLENRWIREVQHRLERGVDHSRGVGRVAVAEVRFQVDADGAMTGLAVTPSGSEALDEVALAAVRRAGVLPRPPQSLVGRPVAFRLEVSRPEFQPYTW